MVKDFNYCQIFKATSLPKTDAEGNVYDEFTSQNLDIDRDTWT